MSMEIRRCFECGVTCWHNSCASKERAPRCTFCGHPPGGNSGTSKKEYFQLIIRRQADRARLLGITRGYNT